MHGDAEWAAPASGAADRPRGGLYGPFVPLVYDFWTGLDHDRVVSDDAFERARAALGEQGVVDLIGLNGYYTFLAMIMNAAQTPVPQSDAPPLAVVRSARRPAR